MKLPCFFLLLSLIATIAKAQGEIAVYPNPFYEETTIVANPHCGDSISLEILDRWGQSRLHIEDGQVYHPDTSSFLLPLETGMYVAVIKVGQNKIVHKLVRTNDNIPHARVNLVLSPSRLNCVEYPFNIFPIPSSDGTFYVRQPNTALAYNIEIWNSAGKRVFHQKMGPHPVDQKFELAHAGPGLYYIRVTSFRGVETHKIMLSQ